MYLPRERQHLLWVFAEPVVAIFEPLGRALDGLQWCAVVRRNGQIDPSLNIVLVGRLEEKVARHPDKAGQGLSRAAR